MRYNENTNELYHLFLSLPYMWEVYMALRGLVIFCYMNDKSYITTEDIPGNTIVNVFSPGRIQLFTDYITVTLRSKK